MDVIVSVEAAAFTDLPLPHGTEINSIGEL